MTIRNNENRSSDSSHRADRTIEWLTIALCVLSLLVAGALGAKVRTGGTGSTVTYGVIDDFGSIVVNGVHYDESAADIIIDGISGQPRSSLKLGMVVEIEGERDYALNTGVADTVRVNRTLLGQVQRFDAQTGEIQILEQQVATNAVTRFDGLGGFSTLAAGDWVSIHGLDDPGRKTLVATLVERIDGSVNRYSTIRGTVRNPHPGWFRIGALDVITAGAIPEDGDYVSVSGTYDAGARQLLASEVNVTREVDVVDGDETELQGYVADFRGVGDFTIAGVPVDATRAEFSGGRANDLKPGAKITVEGIVRNGILFAEEVEFAMPESATSRSAIVEVEGRITTFTSIENFVVKGRLVDASLAIIRNNSGRAPGAGLKAHVKGAVDNDGILRATRLVLEGS